MSGYVYWLFGLCMGLCIVEFVIVLGFVLGKLCDVLLVWIG